MEGWLRRSCFFPAFVQAHDGNKPQALIGNVFRSRLSPVEINQRCHPGGQKRYPPDTLVHAIKKRVARFFDPVILFRSSCCGCRDAQLHVEKFQLAPLATKHNIPEPHKG
jgi:hypothetical protein